jgi:hypothetical protein
MKTKSDQIISFNEKKIETKLLRKQSGLNYLLLKDENKQYYIHRLKDQKTVLVGSNDEAEAFILYGLNDNISEVKQLFIQQK